MLRIHCLYFIPQDQPANLKVRCIPAEAIWCLWVILSKMYFNISREKFIGVQQILVGLQDTVILLTDLCSMELPLSCLKECLHFLMLHARSEEHTSELQSQSNLVCRL